MEERRLTRGNTQAAQSLRDLCVKIRVQRSRIRAQELYLEKASVDTKAVRLQTVNLRDEHQTEIQRWSDVTQNIMLELVSTKCQSIPVDILLRSTSRRRQNDGMR